MDDLANSVVREQERLAAARMGWETHWQEIAERVLPDFADFQVTRERGSSNTERLVDSTATLAVNTFGSALAGLLVPSENTWATLSAGVPELDRLPRVQRYFEQLNRVLFTERYRAGANFYNQYVQKLTMLGAFGTTPLWVHEDVGRGIYYKALHIKEIFVCENERGQIDKVYRKFEFTARQAAQRWGQDALPPKIVKALAEKPEDKFWFAQCFMPREDFDPYRAGAKGMPIRSITVAVDGKHVVSDGGYTSMPLLTSRYMPSPGDAYGRSPAMMVLPDIRMVNEMAKTMLSAAHMHVRPPLLVADDGVMSVRQVPGALNFGGLSAAGTPMVRPLETGARLEAGMEMLNASRATINSAFLVNLFALLVETPDRMTATEVLDRAREKGMLMAPVAGREEAESLGPMIEREIDLVTRMGKAPPMPGELQEAKGEYKIGYDNPLSRARRAEAALGLLRTVEQIAPFAQADPNVLKIFNAEACVRGLAEINAVPPSWLRTPDEVAALEGDQAGAAQAQALVDAAPGVSKAALDWAKAEQIASETAAVDGSVAAL